MGGEDCEGGSGGVIGLASYEVSFLRRAPYVGRQDVEIEGGGDENQNSSRTTNLARASKRAAQVSFEIMERSSLGAIRVRRDRPSGGATKLFVGLLPFRGLATSTPLSPRVDRFSWRGGGFRDTEGSIGDLPPVEATVTCF